MSLTLYPGCALLIIKLIEETYEEAYTTIFPQLQCNIDQKFGVRVIDIYTKSKSEIEDSFI